MKILLATISPRRSTSSSPAALLLCDYVERIARHVPCEAREFPDEAKLLAQVQSLAGRTAPSLVLTDSRGQQVSSTELAAAVGRMQDNGLQQLIVAIGPADGWSAAALARADLTIAFGRITLPHELAAVVAAEQVYRALTIRAGHPYHSGH